MFGVNKEVVTKEVSKEIKEHMIKAWNSLNQDLNDKYSENVTVYKVTKGKAEEYVAVGNYQSLKEENGKTSEYKGRSSVVMFGEDKKADKLHVRVWEKTPKDASSKEVSSGGVGVNMGEKPIGHVYVKGSFPANRKTKDMSDMADIKATLQSSRDDYFRAAKSDRDYLEQVRVIDAVMKNFDKYVMTPKEKEAYAQSIEAKKGKEYEVEKVRSKINHDFLKKSGLGR